MKTRKAAKAKSSKAMKPKAAKAAKGKGKMGGGGYSEERGEPKGLSEKKEGEKPMGKGRK